MTSILDVITLVPLFFMTYIQIMKVTVPTFKAPREQQEELSKKLRKEHALDGFIGVVDAIVCIWFVAALVYLHNYQVDAWHSTEALWSLKFISALWTLMWLDLKGYLRFGNKNDTKKQ